MTTEPAGRGGGQGAKDEKRNLVGMGDTRTEDRRTAWFHAAGILEAAIKEGFSVAEAEGISPHSPRGRRLNEELARICEMAHRHAIGFRHRRRHAHRAARPGGG